MVVNRPPLNYTGGKYKLLPKLMPLFPTNISTFVDPFMGGGTMVLNVKAEKIIANDIVSAIPVLYNEFKKVSGEHFFNVMCSLIDKYQLSKTNQEGFLQLRQDYNDRATQGDIDPYLFFALICYSFNNDLRFNSKGGYNTPFGRNRSSFNVSISDRLHQTCRDLKNINVEFCNRDFKQVIAQCVDSLDKDSFVYLDPPYLITVANYNSYWSEQCELDLYAICDYLHSLGIKFGLSNVVEHKGKTNDILKNWLNSRSYNVHYLDYDYSNANYNTNRGSSVEIFVTNY